MMAQEAPVTGRPSDEGRAQAALRGAYMEVDLGAIAHNVGALRQWLSPSTRLMAVVKADAYGHGALPVAQTALQAGADALGVATVTEGVKLRAAGIAAPILLLGLPVPEALETAIAAGIELTVSSLAGLAHAEAAASALGTPARLHVKVDTGMTRVGAPPAEVADLAKRILASRWLEWAGLESHLACAEDLDEHLTREQLARFERVLADLAVPPGVLTHVANSAGTLFFPSSHHAMVRPGLMIYGVSPRSAAALPFRLRPAMRLHARITQLREVEPGVQVGYGATYTTSKPSTLAILPVGYADGLPRALSNGHPVLVAGQRRPIVGRVSMDQCTVDVTGLGVGLGEAVVLMGSQGDESVEVEAWAQAAGTIPYEIMCGLGRRLPRVYVR